MMQPVAGSRCGSVSTKASGVVEEGVAERDPVGDLIVCALEAAALERRCKRADGGQRRPRAVERDDSANSLTVPPLPPDPLGAPLRARSRPPR